MGELAKSLESLAFWRVYRSWSHTAKIVDTQKGKDNRQLSTNQPVTLSTLFAVSWHVAIVMPYTTMSSETNRFEVVNGWMG